MRYSGMGLAAALALMLAGCGNDAAETPREGGAETGGTVSGDIRGGTISDAMIPLEQLSSQSPPLERPASTSEPAAGGDEAQAEEPAQNETGAAPEAAAPAEE